MEFMCHNPRTSLFIGGAMSITHSFICEDMQVFLMFFPVVYHYIIHQEQFNLSFDCLAAQLHKILL